MAGSTKADLQAEVERLTAREQYLHQERQRIMADAQRNHARGKLTEQWVGATYRVVEHSATGPVFGTLHVRDPHAPPLLKEPTTRGGRYLSGRTREAGPGSHIGLALCGWPLMADELWVAARGILQHAYNRQRHAGVCDSVALCGMCSYLSGQPTIDAAWEAISG